MAKCANCEHGMWDHEFLDEDYDGDMYFGKCEIEGCPCERYEED